MGLGLHLLELDMPVAHHLVCHVGGLHDRNPALLVYHEVLLVCDVLAVENDGPLLASEFDDLLLQPQQVSVQAGEVVGIEQGRYLLKG